jgi:hypothetical protein
MTTASALICRTHHLSSCVSIDGAYDRSLMTTDRDNAWRGDHREVRTEEMTEELPFEAANVETVVRVGDTVRRTTGPWTPSVHALLKHLERQGFDGAPRVLGFDHRGREILTHIPGQAGLRPWPANVRTPYALASVAELIRRFHNAVASFVPSDDAVWRFGTGSTAADEIVTHNDLAPWNTIYDETTATTLIDWDFARPARAIEDVAYAAWTYVPLRDDEHSLAIGFERPHDRAARLDLFLTSYGLDDRRGFVDEIIERKLLEQSWVIEMAAKGIEPWAKFLREGHADHVTYDIDYLESIRTPLDAVCR